MEPIQPPDISAETKQLPPEKGIAIKWLAFLLGLALTVIVVLFNRGNGSTAQQLDDKEKQLADKEKTLNDCYVNNAYWQERARISDSTAKADVTAARKETNEVYSQALKDKDEAARYYQKLLSITNKVK